MNWDSPLKNHSSSHLQFNSKSKEELYWGMREGRKVEDWRNGMRSEEKRMEGMEGTRVFGEHLTPQNLSFLSLILQLISNGSWVNDWASIWVQIGVKMVKKSAKTGLICISSRRDLSAKSESCGVWFCNFLRTVLQCFQDSGPFL